MKQCAQRTILRIQNLHFPTLVNALNEKRFPFPETVPTEFVAILSPFHNVYLNLCLEEAIAQVAFPCVATSPSEPSSMRPYHMPSAILFAYRNNPSVVIGTNQNPWREVNLRRIYHRTETMNVEECIRDLERELRDGNTKSFSPVLARRFSGGGAVYHDLGNVNFSVITPRQHYNPDQNLHILQAYVSSILNQREDNRFSYSEVLSDVKDISSHDHQPPFDLKVTSRHDLLLNGKKVTGSGMRLNRGFAYHHFTFLVSSRLTSAGDRHNQSKFHSLPEFPHGVLGMSSLQTASLVKTGGISSVPSPITTLWNELVMNTHQNNAPLPLQLPAEEEEARRLRMAQKFMESFAEFWTIRNNHQKASPSTLPQTLETTLYQLTADDHPTFMELLGTRCDDDWSGKRRVLAVPIQQQVFRMMSTDYLYSCHSETKSLILLNVVFTRSSNEERWYNRDTSIVSLPFPWDLQTEEMVDGNNRVFLQLEVEASIHRRSVRDVNIKLKRHMKTEPRIDQQWLEMLAKGLEIGWCGMLVGGICKEHEVDVLKDSSSENAFSKVLPILEAFFLQSAIVGKELSEEEKEEVVGTSVRRLTVAWVDQAGW